MSLKDYLVNLIRRVVPRPNSYVTEWTYVTDYLPRRNEICETIIFEMYRGRLENPKISVLKHLRDGYWEAAGDNVVVCWRSFEGVGKLFSGGEL